MDGVLADFDTQYMRTFGAPITDSMRDHIDWKKVRETEDFFLNIPPMPDMEELWAYCEPYNPKVLTGIPASVPEAPWNKMAWVKRHLGNLVEVQCCQSKYKYQYCKPGDILIDDWTKYRVKWIDAGGIWITHFSAKESIHQLEQILRLTERLRH
jgi:hypothetical protein